MKKDERREGLTKKVINTTKSKGEQNEKSKSGMQRKKQGAMMKAETYPDLSLSSQYSLDCGSFFSLSLWFSYLYPTIYKYICCRNLYSNDVIK